MSVVLFYKREHLFVTRDVYSILDETVGNTIDISVEGLEVKSNISPSFLTTNVSM